MSDGGGGDGGGWGGEGCDHHHQAPARLEGGGAGEIPLEEQEARSAEHRAEMAKIAGPAGSPFKGSYQLFAAIRGGDRDRARELLQTGADPNAWESPAWYIFPGTMLMPCILCCAFCAPVHYSMQPLHVAMEEGDAEMVKLCKSDPLTLTLIA